MVRLYLNNQEVIVDSSSSVKITRENPYITQSDSYTLDVSLPLSILQNRVFFGNIQRLDTTKSNTEIDARLMNGNDILLEGTARIIQSSELDVKVQLANGISALKIAAKELEEYIDVLIDEPSVKSSYQSDGEDWHCLDYGPIEIANHKGYGAILHDKTSDLVVNAAGGDIYGRWTYNIVSECPRLIDIAYLVAEKLGYELDLSYLPEACSHIYVISSIPGNIGRKLPHWTVKQFLAEFQNFFGCAFVRAGNRLLKLIPLSSFIDNQVTSITPSDEYKVDYSKDDVSKGVMNSNIEFSMTESDTEIVDEDILEQATHDVTYQSIGEMENAFIADNPVTKLRKIYRCDGEIYVGWEKDEDVYELRKVAPFNPLIRFENKDSVELKIAPAFMEEDVDCEVSLMVGSSTVDRPRTFKYTCHLPKVDNPFGIKVMKPIGEPDSSTLQDLIEGNENIVSEEDKSDIMSVAFIDGLEEKIKVENEDGSYYTGVQIHLAYTDCNFKKQFTNNRRKWSFSLNELQGCDFYLGQLHKIGFHCDGKVKYTVKFTSIAIPDPTDIFIINGKEFACEKIEADVRDGELEHLMTGYFYSLSRS